MAKSECAIGPERETAIKFYDIVGASCLANKDVAQQSNIQEEK